MTQQNNEKPPRSEHKRTWSNIHLITLHPDTLACPESAKMGVQIAKSSDHFALYTWELVQISDDGKRYSRMRVPFSGRRTGRIDLPAIEQDIVKLFQLARIWLHERMQEAEDNWVEFENARAKKNDDRSKPKQHMGLKQLSKRDAALKGLPNKENS